MHSFLPPFVKHVLPLGSGAYSLIITKKEMKCWLELPAGFIKGHHIGQMCQGFIGEADVH